MSCLGNLIPFGAGELSMLTPLRQYLQRKLCNHQATLDSSPTFSSTRMHAVRPGYNCLELDTIDL